MFTRCVSKFMSGEASPRSPKEGFFYIVSIYSRFVEDKKKAIENPERAVSKAHDKSPGFWYQKRETDPELYDFTLPRL